MQSPVVAPLFACEVRPDRERVIVRTSGELDLAEAPSFERTLMELLDVGFRRIVVDLRELSFMDSTGLYALLSVRETALANDGGLSLIRGSRHLHRIFELTGTASLFVFEDAPTLR